MSRRAAAARTHGNLAPIHPRNDLGKAVVTALATPSARGVARLAAISLSGRCPPAAVGATLAVARLQLLASCHREADAMHKGIAYG